MRRALPLLPAAMVFALAAWAEPAPVSRSAAAVVDSLLGRTSRAPEPNARADSLDRRQEASVAPDSASLPLRAQRVLELRAAEEAGDARRAKTVLAADSRVWFEAHAGAGERRDPGGKDAFADWDRYFHAQKQVSFVSAAADSVEFDLVETNDFYKLLDRPPSHARLVYWFDAADRITGTLVQSIPPPPGAAPPANRMPEFEAWERARDAKLLSWLLPNGRLDSDLAHARRWKRELVAWRRAAGLPEVPGTAP